MASENVLPFLYFDTIASAVRDPRADVVRGTFARYDPETNQDGSTTGAVRYRIQPIQSFIIPSLHFMQQAVYIESLARDFASEDQRLKKHFDEVRTFFRQRGAIRDKL